MAQETEAGNKVGHGVSRPCPILSHSCDAAVLLGEGVVNFERSRVK